MEEEKPVITIFNTAELITSFVGSKELLSNNALLQCSSIASKHKGTVDGIMHIAAESITSASEMPT